ncbi:hypothetical protein MSG28_008029 [Choristoneura fumiferana]|uniref:Uncharacterized protein n=1 Tax=Choristoneura fumiferana TaxID=7141 RepID=A0ACC0J9M7_CHOFU|nr:hypothetical protein MSG28_008029 [Choristoneura fumiferana]
MPVCDEIDIEKSHDEHLQCAFEKYASSHKGVSDNLDAWIRDVGIYSRLRGRRSAHVSHAGAEGTRGDLENSYTNVL